MGGAQTPTPEEQQAGGAKTFPEAVPFIISISNKINIYMAPFIISSSNKNNIHIYIYI